MLIRKLSGIQHVRQQIAQVRYDLRAAQLQEHILYDQTNGTSEQKYFPYMVIVSLTTFGRRLDSVPITIESLMQQTLKANKIVLWLDERLQGEEIPLSLQNQEKRGLEIRYCKDIRAYKKLVPSLRAYPEDAILTVDDDVIYPYNLIERFVREHRLDPHLILCSKHHRMKVGTDGRLASYKEWEKGSPILDASIMNFPTGVGGVLYPPHSLDPEVLNEKVFMEICSSNDDIWFKAMGMKKGTFSKRISSHSANGIDYIEDSEVQDIGLFHRNVVQNYNDEQIKSVFTRYNLYSLLTPDQNE